jgi:hypothetical protein
LPAGKLPVTHAAQADGLEDGVRSANAGDLGPCTDFQSVAVRAELSQEAGADGVVAGVGDGSIVIAVEWRSWQFLEDANSSPGRQIPRSARPRCAERALNLKPSKQG